MKKLITALGVVAVAAGVHAASVTWTESLAIYTPIETATPGTYTKAGGSGAKLVTMYVLEFTGATTGWESKSAKEIWDNYKGEYTSWAKATTGGSGKANVTGTTNYGENDYASAVAILTIDTDQDGNVDYYIATTATDPSKVGTGISINVPHGTTSTDVSAWNAVAVPEPTSGLLLLLGVAGLALRRKQK